MFLPAAWLQVRQAYNLVGTSTVTLVMMVMVMMVMMVMMGMMVMVMMMTMVVVRRRRVKVTMMKALRTQQLATGKTGTKINLALYVCLCN